MIPTNIKVPVGYGKVREGLGSTDKETLEFRIQRKGNKAKSRITAWDFSRADFVLFRDLLVRVPQGTTVGRGPGELVVFQESISSYPFPP